MLLARKLALRVSRAEPGCDGGCGGGGKKGADSPGWVAVTADTFSAMRLEYVLTVLGLRSSVSRALD